MVYSLTSENAGDEKIIAQHELRNIGISPTVNE